MQTSIWDKNEIETLYPECTTLREVLSRIENDFSSRGEVICEIRVNGMILNESDETTFANNPRDGITDLAVRSDRPSDLIRDALTSATGFLPELERSAIKTAELFRGRDQGSAQRSFAETLEGCQWLIDTLMHVRGAAAGLSEPIKNEAKWTAGEEMITRVLHEINSAVQKQDSVLIADLLEYELTAAVAEWSEAIAVESASRT